MIETSPDSGDPTSTPLTELLRRRMDEHGWRLRDVTQPPDGIRDGAPARATMSWHLQPGQWLRAMPRAKTLEQLAVAVRLPVKEIREAAFASLEANGSRPVGRSRGHRGGRTVELSVQSAEDEEKLRAFAEFLRSQNPAAGD